MTAKESAQKYRTTHPEIIAARRKEYYLSHKLQENQRNKDWREKRKLAKSQMMQKIVSENPAMSILPKQSPVNIPDNDSIAFPSDTVKANPTPSLLNNISSNW